MFEGEEKPPAERCMEVLKYGGVHEKKPGQGGGRMGDSLEMNKKII